MKKVLFICLTFAAVAGTEFLRTSYGIPVTTMDILLTPFCLVLVGVIIVTSPVFERFKNRNIPKKRLKTGPAGPKPLWASMVGALFFPLGAWCFSMGVEKPFELFTSIKADVHGYTMIAMGVFIMTLGLLIVYIMFESLHAKYVKKIQ